MKKMQEHDRNALIVFLIGLFVGVPILAFAISCNDPQVKDASKQNLAFHDPERRTDHDPQYSRDGLRELFHHQLYAYCDEETGNLLYVGGGSWHTGSGVTALWVVEGGCEIKPAASSSAPETE